MANIPVHYAGDLASSRTPVLGPDTSAQVIAQSLAGVAGTAADVLAKRQEAIDKLNVESLQTDAQTQYLRKQHEIMKDPQTNSQNIEERLNSAWMDIKSQVIGGVTDGSVRQAADLALQSEYNNIRLNSEKAKLDLQDKETVNRIFDNSSKLIDVVSQLGDADRIPWAFKKLDETESTLLPFMGNDLANTRKYIQNSKDTLIKQFVAAGISNGREDELEAAEMLGKFSSASPSVKEQISKDIATAIETKKYRADLTTSFQVVNDNLQTYKDLRSGAKTFADVEHLLSEETYKLKTGNFSEKQKESIQGRITFLNSLRTAELQQSYIRARDDLDTKTGLEVELTQLLETYDGNKELRDGVYLDQIKAFQDKLTKAFVDDKKISGKTYNTLYSEALGVLYKGFAESTFEKSGWDNVVGVFNKDVIPEPMKAVIAKDSRLPILRIYDAFKKTDGTTDPKALVAAFEEYLDDKSAGRDLSVFTPTAAQEYAMRAKLKLAGFPGSYQIGDPIVVQGRSFKIGGFKNGEVLLETDEAMARNIVTYAKPYKTMRK